MSVFGGGLVWFGGGLGWFGVFWGGLGCFNGPHVGYHLDGSVFIIREVTLR